MSDMDLGGGHTLRWMGFDPDLDLNPQYAHLADLLPVEKYGAIERHPTETTSGFCEGVITFAGPVQQAVEPDHPSWTVESWDPLTLSPSILCGACGNHGFIREGRWVDA